jgi:lysophospholipase L1-like esterase
VDTNAKVNSANPFSGTVDPVTNQPVLYNIIVRDTLNGVQGELVIEQAYVPAFLAAKVNIPPVTTTSPAETTADQVYPINPAVTQANIVQSPFAASLQSVQSPVFLAEGDSITYGAYLANPAGQNYAFLAIQAVAPSCPYYNQSVGGSRCATVKSRLANDISILGLFSGQRIFSLMIGSNDLGNDPTQTPVSVYGAIQSIISQVIAESGAKCIVCTIPPGNFTLAGTPAEYEAKRLALNDLIFAGAAGTPPYFVCNIGGDPTIGQTGQNTAPYYQADGIHPAYAGQQIAADDLMTALQLT